MKKQIKILRHYIGKKMPYRFHNILLALSFIVFMVMIIIVIVMNFLKIEPRAFDENNTSTYTYVEVNQVQKLNDEYYVADDGTFVYLYYDDGSNVTGSMPKIVGVPKLIDEEKLTQFIPMFQKLYPQLKINNVADVMKYTGNYYFDNTVPPLLYDMQVIVIFSCFPFMCWLILLAFKEQYKRCYFHSLKELITNREVTVLIEELKTPRVVYNSINVMVLYDYLIINHPSPYIINFDNIVWAYVERKRGFLLFDQELTLVIYDQNLKKTRVLIATVLSAHHKKEIDELLLFISQNYSKILIGYSQHNEIIFQQLKKDNDI